MGVNYIIEGKKNFSLSQTAQVYSQVGGRTGLIRFPWTRLGDTVVPSWPGQDTTSCPHGLLVD